MLQPLINPAPEEHEAYFASALCRAVSRLSEAEISIDQQARRRQTGVQTVTLLARAYAELTLARSESDYAAMPDEIFESTDEVAKGVLEMINTEAQAAAGYEIGEARVTVGVLPGTLIPEGETSAQLKKRIAAEEKQRQSFAASGLSPEMAALIGAPPDQEQDIVVARRELQRSPDEIIADRATKQYIRLFISQIRNILDQAGFDCQE